MNAPQGSEPRSGPRRPARRARAPGLAPLLPRFGVPGLGMLLLLGLLRAEPARAQALELELVLALDASSSVERGEFDLQVQGIADAFRHPDVLSALSALDGRAVAVTIVQWSSPPRQHVSVPWTVIGGTAAARAFADRIGAMPRYVGSGGTAIGQAISFAQSLFDRNDYQGARRVIDVSGDGRANMGRRPIRARNEAVEAGVTINGLAIMNEEPNVDRYYANNVIGGPGAFLMTAVDYADFRRAIRQKLVREITGAGIVERAPPTPGSPADRPRPQRAATAAPPNR